MPTPFTHLAVAQRLLVDTEIPQSLRDLLNRHRGAFLLGNVAADARVETGLTRDETHFYSYDHNIIERPWQVMMRVYPQLREPCDDAQRVFLAGYAAHLSIDEGWTQDMLVPYFAMSHWGDRDLRFLMLHILLIHMDERDYALLENWQQTALLQAKPNRWLPFLTDDMLVSWRDLIARQITGAGTSKTLEIMGERVGKTPAQLRAILDSPQQIKKDLWAHIPQKALAEVEAKMYVHARTQMILYLQEFALLKA
jgi:hypothetical protein